MPMSSVVRAIVADYEITVDWTDEILRSRLRTKVSGAENPEVALWQVDIEVDIILTRRVEIP